MLSCWESTRCHVSPLSSKRTFVDLAKALNCFVPAILLSGFPHCRSASVDDFQGGASMVLTMVAKKNAVMLTYSIIGIKSQRKFTSITGSFESMR
jgi:hypothetical protein